MFFVGHIERVRWATRLRPLLLDLAYKPLVKIFNIPAVK